MDLGDSCANTHYVLELLVVVRMKQGEGEVPMPTSAQWEKRSGTNAINK